jgi:DNA polymerase-3 subunit gamma/tau
VLSTADAMAARSVSFDNALAELARLLHRVALVQTAPAALVEDTPERERIVALAQAFDPEDVQLDYQIALHGRQDLPLAPDEYAGFTMTLMRMLAFAPEGADDVAARPIAQSAYPPIGSPDFRSAWPRVARELKVTGAAKQLAERSECVGCEADRVDLAVPPESRALADGAYVEKLQAALAQHLGRAVKVTVRVAAVNGRTAAAIDDSERRMRAAQANADIDNDPFVRELMSSLDATIESVKPIEQGTSR